MSGGYERHVAQHRETTVQARKGTHFAWRYAYARAAETRAAGDKGQDYVAFAELEQAFVFALCDGVSQSFYGDFAAAFMGEKLLGWLKSLTGRQGKDAVQQSLETALQSWTKEATRQLQHLRLPDSLPPLVRDVLEEKRALGSETTFVAGRIDLPSDTHPQGRMLFVWMGDSRLRVWDQRGRRLKLGGEFKTMQRWSTLKGPTGGKPHLVLSPLHTADDTLGRIQVYSDGLAVLDGEQEVLTNTQLNELIRQEGEVPTSDDISYLEIWPGDLPPQVKPTAKVPPPAFSQPASSAPHKTKSQPPRPRPAAPVRTPAPSAYNPSGQAVTPPPAAPPPSPSVPSSPPRPPWKIRPLQAFLAGLVVFFLCGALLGLTWWNNRSRSTLTPTPATGTVSYPTRVHHVYPTAQPSEGPKEREPAPGEEAPGRDASPKPSPDIPPASAPPSPPSSPTNSVTPQPTQSPITTPSPSLTSTPTAMPTALDSSTQETEDH